MKDRLISFLRWTERYTKTDMVYLVQAGFWVNLNIILMSVLGLFLSVALANLLSPDSYGLYQYLLSLSGLVAAISLAGMNVAVAQAVARGYEGVLRTALYAQLRWAIVPALLSGAGALYYFAQGNVPLGIGLAAIAVLTPLGNAFNTYVGFIEGRREFRRVFTLGGLINIASYASVFLALVWVRDAAVLIVVNLGVNAAGMVYAYYRTVTWYQPNDKVDPAAVPYGRHLSVMSAFSVIVSQLDSLLVFHFLGAAQLAVYSLATMLPERVGMLSNFLGIASLPKFANQPLSSIRKSIIGKILRVGGIGAIAAIFYALIAPLAFRFLFPHYLSALGYSEMYVPIIALVAMLNVTNTILIAKRLTREIYVINFTQPALLIGLQVPLLLLYGIWGMIAARLISDSIGICLGLWFTFRPLEAVIDVVEGGVNINRVKALDRT